MPQSRETDNLPSIVVTGVGSLPHTDTNAAVRMVLDQLKSAPHPPQLSRMDPREQMWIQYSEGLPRFQVDLENLNYYFDTSGDPTAEIEEFYTHYLAVTEGSAADAFFVSRDYGRGIWCFLDAIRDQGGKRPVIKVQVTGPLSFALTVTDQDRKPIFYDPFFRDVAVKGMGLKAIWLLEQFKPYADSIIVMFDEPCLSAYGSSAFLGVSKSDVVDSLEEVISMVAERGAIAGVHCCGNTDWSLLTETSCRLINFDAVDYMDSLGIYAKELVAYHASGGRLAWGSVPNTERIATETADDVIDRMRRGVNGLEKLGVDRNLLLDRIVVTPACGCAGLTPQHADKVYEVLSELAKKLTPDLFRK
jgi:hypothetical protein